MQQMIIATAMKRIAPATRLKACSLWAGSHFELEFKYNQGVTYAMLAEKYNSLSKCDDRTPAENEWLAAILATLEDGGFTPCR